MKIIIAILLIVTPALLAFGQMTNNGYQKLKLGMTAAQAKKIVNFNVTKSNEAVVKYDDLTFKLTFSDNKLWTISTSSSNVKIAGINNLLIGKPYSAVKALLGNKLKAADLGGDSNDYYIYYMNQKYKDNYETSCVLHFNSKKILTRIFSAYNP